MEKAVTYEDRRSQIFDAHGNEIGKPERVMLAIARALLGQAGENSPNSADSLGGCEMGLGGTFDIALLADAVLAEIRVLDQAVAEEPLKIVAKK